MSVEQHLRWAVDMEEVSHALAGLMICAADEIDRLRAGNRDLLRIIVTELDQPNDPPDMIGHEGE